MTRPPPFHCELCGKRIAARGRHILLAGGTILCGHCADDDHTHARIYFACPHRTHNLHDHGYWVITRAIAAWSLGKDG
jgi:ribosome-binding protein aMBF1 (putative translation factor)